MNNPITDISHCRRDDEVSSSRCTVDIANSAVSQCAADGDRRVEGGLLEGVTYRKSGNRGTVMDNNPEVIVMHYTAGGSAEGSIEWLCDPAAQASAHVVIARSGEITQLIPFTRIAWHAGRSQWRGRDSVNGFSIGVELANWGLLQEVGSRYTGWTRNTFIPEDLVKRAAHKSDPANPRHWERFTNEQLKEALKLCHTLLSHYPSIVDIVGHDDVAPGRKFDPGPAFPMKAIRCLLFNRQEALV